ncbi:MAG: discoidin domain-containing protein [Planctomycetes bacterium]|nr:discoidin domain-containing protein [Planctomycetota bacterium]
MRARRSSGRRCARGPRAFDEPLPLPRGVPAGPDGRPVFYRDIAVVAFPTPPAFENAMAAAAPRVTSSSSQPPYPPDRAADGDPETFRVSNGYHPGDGPTEARPEWIQLAFAEPFAAASLYVLPRPRWGPTACELGASDDGKTFRRIRRFDVGHGTPALAAFDEVRARIFRLLLTGAYDGGINVQVSEVELLARGERPSAGVPIRDWALKSGNAVLHDPSRPPGATLGEEDPDIPGEAIERRAIIDLSDRLEDEGRLAWDVPEGDWTILRFGHTTTGMQVIFASPGGHGYMLDFLSARAADLQFESMAAPLLDDAGPLAGKSLAYFHDDSWEVGAPNWTVAFRDEFRARRGYDIVPCLPVLARRVVETREVSNRFLRDYRRTIADCIAENHYRRMRERCHERGVGFHAEAFTSIGPHWQEDPFYLKPWGDRAFCEGLTRCFLHTFTHSPAAAGTPGLESFAGTHFNPNITWWPAARAWTDFLARCQFLLSRGTFVADVCYYYGDDVPNFVPPKRVDPSRRATAS